MDVTAPPLGGGRLVGQFGNFVFHGRGRDFPKLFGLGFFHEGLVVAMDDVRGGAGPTRGFALVLVVG